MWKADTNINFYQNLLEQKENGQIKAIEFNFSTICLLCLKNLVKNKSSINFLNTEINISTEMFQLNLNSSDVIMIKDMLLDVMGKQTNSDNNFPQQICENCLDYLKISYFFKSQALKTNNVLKQLLEVSGQPIQNEFGANENEIESESTDLKNSFVEKRLLVIQNVLNDGENNKEKKRKIQLENKEFEKVVEYFDCNNTIDNDEDENEDENGEEEEEEEEDHIYMDNSNMEYYIENEDNESTEIKMEERIDDEILLNQSTENIASENSLPEQNYFKTIKIESLFKCPGCDTIFKSKNSLRIHITIQHPKSKYFNCAECDISFRTLQSLERHLKCHQKDYERKICNYCSKSFLRADDLRRHIRIHTNERPYACKWPSCNKSFKQSSELSTHLSVHNKIEYKCNICDKIFRSRYGIYVHKKTHKL